MPKKIKDILSVVDVRKEFIVKNKFLMGNDEKIVAVKNASFSMEAGKTLGIVGESGSGKSTLGEIAGGLIKATFGKVYYNSKDIYIMSQSERQDYRKNVQFIFQDPKGSMDPYYKIEKIVEEPLYTLNIIKSKKESSFIVDDILSKVGLETSVKGKYPSELSGGQCQRVAIARALIVNPKVIICDEPVSALDVSIQAQILNLLKYLQKEYGIAYMFISHDIGVVNYMADTIIVMNAGNIVEMGEAKSILTHPSQEYTKNLIKSAFVNVVTDAKDRMENR